MTGRLAEAATANASATRKATFAVGPSTMAIAMEIAPTTKAAMRATRRSSLGLCSWPWRMMLVQTSCAKEVEALMVRPATTARMVAKAMAEMNAKKMLPPRALASKGALILLPPFLAMKSRPTMVAAPNPRKVVRM